MITWEAAKVMFWVIGLCPALLAPNIRRTNPVSPGPGLRSLLKSGSQYINWWLHLKT